MLLIQFFSSLGREPTKHESGKTQFERGGQVKFVALESGSLSGDIVREALQAEPVRHFMGHNK